jgi:purine-binding chemotaxis protein CheW
MIDSDRYLCFSLENEEFAIPLLSVKEVMGVPELTRIPQTPTHFLGITNLRGSVISVMDLRAKLGLKSLVNSETTVVILDLGTYFLGVVVDSVNSVLTMKSEDISEKPVITSQKGTDYITGVFRKQNGLVAILDIAKALSVEDHSALAKVQVSPAA